MTNSSHLIHGNITILENFLKSKNTEFDVTKLFVPISITTCNLRLQTLYKEIYNDIESGIYNRFEFLIYYLYQKIYNFKFYILQTNRRQIERIVNVFSYSQLNKDTEIVKNIMQAIDIKELSDLFTINDGYNIAYRLVIKKVSSPMFYLYHYQKYKYSISDDLIGDFNRFNKIINIIYQILKLNKEALK